MNYVTNG